MNLFNDIPEHIPYEATKVYGPGSPRASLEKIIFDKDRPGAVCSQVLWTQKTAPALKKAAAAIAAEIESRRRNRK